MTWILADERTITRTASTDVTDLNAWLDWFYLTYIQTRGFTCVKAVSGNDVYWGITKSLVGKWGNVLNYKMVHETNLSNHDFYVASWLDETFTDPTNIGSLLGGNTNTPISVDYGTWTIQVWESDTDDHSFYVRRKGVKSASHSNSWCLVFPKQCYVNLANPTYYLENWWSATMYQSYASTVEIFKAMYQGTDNTGFISNRWRAGDREDYMNYVLYEGSGEDVYLKCVGNDNITTSTKAVKSTSSNSLATVIDGEYYIDVAGEEPYFSILLKTGAVNPEA